MENNQLIMTEVDYQKLSFVANRANSETAELLQGELDRAAIVHRDQLPLDVVSMNSTVHFKDLNSGESFIMTLVYPDQANISENKISILAPVGAALIGLRAGQTISWPIPKGGERKLEITSVVHQRDSSAV